MIEGPGEVGQEMQGRRLQRWKYYETRSAYDHLWIYAENVWPCEASGGLWVMLRGYRATRPLHIKLYIIRTLCI